MNYTNDNTAFHERAVFANSVKNGRHCYMGFSGYQNTIENSAALLLDARAVGSEGSSLFQYLATNSEGRPHSEFYDYILANVFQEAVTQPEMPWKLNPPGQLRGAVTEDGSGEIVYNATVSIVESGESYLSDAVGKYAFIDVPAGDYTVRAEAVGYATQEANATVTSGTVTTLDIALTVAPTPTPIFSNDVIVDNDDGPPGYIENGQWYTSASTGYDGGTYRYAITEGDAHAYWRAELEAGEYEVSVIYLASSNRAAAARFVISSAFGDHEATIDQTQNSFEWVSLGQVQLAEGCNLVRLCAADSATSPSVVIADAVHFQKVGPPPPSPTPTPPNSWLIK